MKLHRTYLFLIAALLVHSIVPSDGAWSMTTGPTASELVTTLLGDGIEVVDGSIETTCDENSGMTAKFSGGTADIGIESGIILTSGKVDGLNQANAHDFYRLSGGGTAQKNDGKHSQNVGLSGDSDLDELSGKTTYDACVLQFKFISKSEYGNVYFKFVFASEEYNEYVDSSFNDVFGFLLDGENIAFITGTEEAVTINNVNEGKYGQGDGKNSDFFVNNAWMNNGTDYTLGREVEYDGLTTVLIAQKLGLAAGEHTIKLAVADAGDGIYDSGVFLQAGSFSASITPTLSHIEPKTGGTGTRVTMYGAGFVPEYEFECLFGTASASYYRVDDSKIVCTAPSNLLGETYSVYLNYRASSSASFASSDVEGTQPTFFYNVEAAVAGSIFTSPNNIEDQLRDVGGSVVNITLSGVSWVTSFTDEVKKGIIEGMTASYSLDAGWNKVLRPAIPYANVERLSDTVVTITLPAVSGYSIDDDETITVTIPYWVTQEGTVLSAEPTITLRSSASATLGGSFVESLNSEGALSDDDISTELTITLAGTTWVGGTDETRYLFNAQRGNIIDGIESLQQEENGFNSLIAKNIRQETVVRTSDTVVTITIPGSSSYHITSSEEIRVRIPTGAVEQSASVDVATTVGISNEVTFWELFGVTIIATTVTCASVTMACIGLTFTIGCIHYKIVKAKKKREVLKSHKLAETIARKHEENLEEADRQMEMVMNPARENNEDDDL